MHNRLKKSLPILVGLLFPLSGHAEGFTGKLILHSQKAGVSHAITLQNWSVDKRGVPSFDYQYSQSGPGCDYARTGHAVAMFEEGDGHVELNTLTEVNDKTHQLETILFFSDKDGVVGLTAPMDKNKSLNWVTFSDTDMKNSLPNNCNFSKRGDAAFLKK